MPELFGICAEYERKKGWTKADSLLLQAESEEEACRAAGLLADFIYRHLRRKARVRVTGPDGGQIIGEFRRPGDIDGSLLIAGSVRSTPSR